MFRHLVNWRAFVNLCFIWNKQSFHANSTHTYTRTRTLAYTSQTNCLFDEFIISFVFRHHARIVYGKLCIYSISKGTLLFKVCGFFFSHRTFDKSLSIWDTFSMNIVCLLRFAFAKLQCLQFSLSTTSSFGYAYRSMFAFYSVFIERWTNCGLCENWRHQFRRYDVI